MRHYSHFTERADTFIGYLAYHRFPHQEPNYEQRSCTFLSSAVESVRGALLTKSGRFFIALQYSANTPKETQRTERK